MAHRVSLVFMMIFLTSNLFANVQEKRWDREGNVVIDKKQNLMWQDDLFAKSIKRSWSGAKKYCQNLSLKGYSDWKLPSYDELLSIVNYDKSKPTTFSLFKNTASNSYWSSSIDVTHNLVAWYVNFERGHTYSYDKKSEYNVRCARDIIGVNKSKILTGLMWQDNNDTKTIELNWQDSIKYCQNLNLKGYSNWRLPSIKELQTLVDISKNNPAFISNLDNIASSSYWSSSVDVSHNLVAWKVHFRYGYTDISNKIYKNNIRCVRQK